MRNRLRRLLLRILPVRYEKLDPANLYNSAVYDTCIYSVGNAYMTGIYDNCTYN
jgi:hypothetical protein